ncbi:SurA N-terminal domain-containing protein [Aquibium sp. A9E412]|uniref:peptidylprolyl isomerase n=1 Tax=Aquibium sp. A9E412 TaxID=2976767 RepID=UPI0025AF3AE6|nr:SurA N-terminal domain-containing protein [Aquibium sp. A9E412]MDN2565023.1 SurA N-terminal domain-containing protein [Aquibium sp. A9E412]
MTASSRRHTRVGLTLIAAALAMTLAVPLAPAQAAEIRYVVNDAPVTSYDIERRVALLRLQRRSGNLRQAATEEMINQTLRLQEMARRNITISEDAVDQAYQRFASGNNLSVSQLNSILAQSGVTQAHFKDFIRTQMGWNRVLQARYRSTGQMSEQEVVQKMLEQGGQKPTATEYMLQQVIFVVPSAERNALINKRKREAQSMRDRFRGCDSTREFAKGLLDVTVRDLGRVLAPELPPDWKDEVSKTAPGAATPVRVTERGVEFIGVCSTREVSDDRVAQMVFQSEQSDSEIGEKLSEEFMAELREKARIVER